jgi:hypothetical protein
VLRSTLKRTFSPYAYLVFFWSTFVMRKHRWGCFDTFLQGDMFRPQSNKVRTAETITQ